VNVPQIIYLCKPLLIVSVLPPVYLDHILYPTITASGFTTEVFHVNGKGEEAGVVMSEMQGVEQNPTTVLARKLVLQFLYRCYDSGSY